jgi:signal peptidase I
MDLDLPLILSVAVALSGLVWAADAAWLRRRRPEGAAEPRLVEYARSFFPVLLLVYVVRSFLVEPYQIPSGSMIPTLEVGDFIAVNKYAYGIRIPVLNVKVIDVGEPRRGDVMVFVPPHETRYFIKRVIGVAGDTIEYRDKVVYVNGVPMPQRLVAEFPPAAPRLQVLAETLDGVEHALQHVVGVRQPDARFTVPAGHYFMMGDNRDNSEDSRVWGMVPDDRVVGRAFAVWVHKPPGLAWPTFARNGFIH